MQRLMAHFEGFEKGENASPEGDTPMTVLQVWRASVAGKVALRFGLFLLEPNVQRICVHFQRRMIN